MFYGASRSDLTIGVSGNLGLAIFPHCYACVQLVLGLRLLVLPGGVLR